MAIVIIDAKAGAPSPATTDIVKKDEPAAKSGGNGTGLVILSEVNRNQPVVPGIGADMKMGLRQALGEGEIYIAGDPLMDLGVGYAEKAAALVKGALNTAGNTVKGGTAVLRVGMQQAIENGASDAQRLGFREGGLAGMVGATIVEKGVRGLATMVRKRQENKKK